MWGITTNASLSVRLLIVGLTGAIGAVGINEGVRLVVKREAREAAGANGTRESQSAAAIVSSNNQSGGQAAGTITNVGPVFNAPVTLNQLPESKIAPTTSEKLPGFSWYNVISINPLPLPRKQYVFEFRDKEGAGAAFYLSASNAFVFEATDIHGSSYHLDIALGRNGIPVGQFIILFCEIGVGSNYSFFRAVVNGKEVQRRDLPFAVDLGSKQWSGKIGADINGKNNGAFDLMTFVAVNSLTLSDEEIERITNDAKAHRDIQ